MGDVKKLLGTDTGQSAAMRRRILLLSLAMFVGVVQVNFGQDAKEKEAKKDLDKLQGTWVVADFVQDGRTLDEPVQDGAKFVFAGDKLSLVTRAASKGESSTFKLDEKTKPKSIDLTCLDGLATHVPHPWRKLIWTQ